MLQAAIDWITGKSLRDALEYATAHGNEDEAAALHHQIAERQGIVNEFAALTKTPDGRLVATGEATQDEANRAMAQFVVNHILHLTTYRDAEGNLQALEAAGALPLKRPWRIVSGPDAGRDIGVVQRGSRNIGSADETVGTRVIRTHPYEDIAPGDVRLFHPHTHDLDRATSQSGAPGRSWTPNFSIAARQARTGNVYWMDVPQAVAERMGYHAAEGIATSAEDFTREAMAAQTAGLNVTHHGYLESGDIAHANMDEAGLPNRIVDMLSRGLVPSNAELARIPREHYPDSFIAPNQMAVVDPKHVIRDFLNKGMKVLVGRPANWMSRQPIWTHNYVMARVELAKAFKAYNIPDASGDLAHDVASERATNASIPYIHDARTRSQFSAITRTLMPFWFAQEQFYKRWGRLFLRNPEAFYKLQLTMNGLRSVGFIQKDAYGQDSFVYPGSPLVLKFLAGAFGGSLPVSVGFQSEVAQLNPTLATGGAPYPSFGPLVTLPLSLLASYFPAEFSGAAALTAGPNAPKPDYSDSPLDLAFKGVMGQLFPSVVTRAFGALQATDDPTSSAYSSQYMTAMVQAVQQLEATGHGLPANATFAERDKFVALVHNWAKTLMYARAAFGFIAPATPNFKIADTGLGKEFTDLLSVMPDYQTAVTAFIKAHGQEASPYTVFASTTAGPGQSGAYVPATQKALEFIASNQPFFDKYPQAAPWFFPLSTGKGPFEDQAYQNELQMGMRSRRAFGPPALRAIGHDWLDEVLYGMSANVYFPLEQQIKAQEAADPNQAPELKAAWTAWSTQFKTDHPLFAANLTNSDARTRRTAVIGDLQKALKDDALPDTPQAQHIKVLMDAYQMVVDFHTANANISADRSQFTANWKAFVEWGTAYAGLFPDVAPFFNGVLSLQKVG
jgi:hypothetical protein